MQEHKTLRDHYVENKELVALLSHLIWRTLTKCPATEIGIWKNWNVGQPSELPAQGLRKVRQPISWSLKFEPEGQDLKNSSGVHGDDGVHSKLGFTQATHAVF